MTSLHTTSRSKTLLGLSLLCACMAIAFALPAAALEDEQDKDLPPPTDKTSGLELQYYVVMPRPHIYTQREHNPIDPQARRNVYSDPSIIPFNGWSFFDREGNEQTWRRRGEINKDIYSNSGGQLDVSRDKKPRLDIYWRQPVSEKTTPQRCRITSERHKKIFSRRWQFARIGVTREYHYYRGQYPFESIEKITDTVPVEIRFAYGPWETVAKATADSELPVGNDHLKIEYIGKPRDARHTPRSVLESPNEYPFEIYYALDVPRDHWEYRVEYYDKKGARRMGNEALTDEGIYVWPSRLPVDELDRIDIQRRPVKYDKLEPVNLSGAVGIWKEDFVQKRIDLSPEHRFSEPVAVDVELSRPGAACMIDLDRARIVTMPDPARIGDELLKLYEHEGIDLVIGSERSQLIANTIGCTYFYLPDDFWDATPQDCVAYLFDRRRSPMTQTAMQEKRLFLITTTDGGMVLIRATQAQYDHKAKAGSGTIEVRRLLGADK